MSTQVLTDQGWKRIDRGNRLSSERRSAAAQLGRGLDAFTARESRDWKAIEARMAEIERREKSGAGSQGTGRMLVERLSPHLNLHVLPLAGCAVVEVV